MRKTMLKLLKNPAVQTLIASLLCILAGLVIGFIVLLIINPAGAWDAILVIIKNFFKYPQAKFQLKNLGNTLVKRAPLVMCSLSVLFAYKVGLFNIGAAGQYVAGAGAAIYLAIKFNLPWPVTLLAACLAGALLGGLSGMLKAYRNVNEVISCIMLNWISLYLVNILLATVKESTSPYVVDMPAGTLMPTLGLGALFSNNKYVTIGVPLAILMAVIVWLVMAKTKFGYELKATGLNKNAARYCGMGEKRNIILTMMIAGALAGMGAALLYLSGFEKWKTTLTSLPDMGFNGIAAAFLGGLNPIASIFSSYFIQHITIGGSYVNAKVYPSEISSLISSVIIYLCAFVLFVKHIMNTRIAASEEKHAAKKEAV